MNGEPLPHWNGFPARIVVPGWTATYWVKQVASIQALVKPLGNFWMGTAYRVPKGKFALVDRFLSQEAEATTPITEVLVNSLVTGPTEGERLHHGRPATVRGIAWDAGYGIRRVEVSLDAGRSWQAAELGTDLGRFSFRPWQFNFVPSTRGALVVMARASNALGATQVEQLIFNNPGYHNNVVQSVNVVVS